MLQFNSIKIKSFLSIGELEYNFLQRRVIEIQGINNTDFGSRSNGTGKTSIWDAILFSLTGYSTRGNTALGKLKNIYSKDAALIILDITVNGKNIIIENSYDKNADLKFWVDGEEQSTSKNLNNKRTDLKALLGKYGEFEFISSTIYLSTDYPIKLSNMSHMAFKNFIEGIFFDSGRIQHISDLLEAKIRECSNNVLTYSSKLSGIESSKVKFKELSNESFEDFGDTANQKEIIKTKLSALNTIKNDINKKVIELNREVATNKQQLSTFKTNILFFQKGLCPTCNQPLENAESKIKELSAQCTPVIENIDVINNNIKQYTNTSDSAINSIQLMNKELTDIEITINKKNSYDMALRKLEILDNEIKNLRKDLLEVEDILEQLKTIQSKLFPRGSKEKGLKDYIISQVFTAFKNNVKNVSSFFFDEDVIDIELKTKLVASLRNREFILLSAGEKRRLDFVLQLALLLTLRNANLSSNLIVFDETLDALDAAGIESYSFYLQELKKIYGIYFISHNPKTQGTADEIITMVKDNDIAHIQNIKILT